MTDLFGNEEPVKTAKSVVRKNRSLENQPSINIHPLKSKAEIVPVDINTEGYDFSQIRRKFHNDKWWFAYKDVVAVLADTKALDMYCTDLKKRMIKEGFQWSEKILVLKLTAADGKSYRTSCFSQEDIIRLIEEIPSSKAEPLKQEIARLTNERIEEIKNPDLAIKRGYEGYLKKGMTPKKAMARAKSVVARVGLTDEWKSHGIEKPKEYAMLTDRESKGIFGQTTSEMKRDRDLAPLQSLRDNMSLSELAAQFVGDVAIAQLIEKDDPYGYDENAVEVDKGSSVGARVLADLNRLLEE